MEQVMNELLEQIKVVALARESARQAKETKDMAYSVWEQEHVSLMNAVGETTKLVSDSESKLRELTIQAYRQTGNKTPSPGVGIREVTKLEYDPKEAFDWAIEHKIMLKLDVSGFEKMAKMAAETCPSFVRTHIEPQATIATDLNKILSPPIKEE